MARITNVVFEKQPEKVYHEGWWRFDNTEKVEEHDPLKVQKKRIMENIARVYYWCYVWNAPVLKNVERGFGSFWRFVTSLMTLGYGTPLVIHNSAFKEFKNSKEAKYCEELAQARGDKVISVAKKSISIVNAMKPPSKDESFNRRINDALGSDAEGEVERYRDECKSAVKALEEKVKELKKNHQSF